MHCRLWDVVVNPIGFFNLGDHLKRHLRCGRSLVGTCSGAWFRGISRPFEYGAPDATIAHEQTSKYADNLSLCHQAQIMSLQGIEPDKPTFPDWVGMVA